MKTRKTFARVSATLAISLFSSIAFAQVTQVTDRNTIINSMGADYIDWQRLDDGIGEFTYVSNPTSVISNGLLALTVTQNPLNLNSLIISEPSAHFRDTNLPDGFLLDTADNGNAHNPFSFSFFDEDGPGFCSFGTQIAPGSAGLFRARIAAFDSDGNLMDAVDANGDPLEDFNASSDDESAVFMGVSSNSMNPISRVEISLMEDAFGNLGFQSRYVINRVDFTACEEASDVPVYSCEGFASPMAKGAVKVKKNRALPLKMELIDDAGFAITDMDLAAPPLVSVIFGLANPGDDPEDVSDYAVAAGHGTDGNQFEFTLDDIWQFNLKTSNYTGSGEYYISVESGDPGEYVIDPTCVASFIVK